MSPQFAKQAMLEVVNSWVEQPFVSGHLFVVPRVHQRDFGRVHKSIRYIDVTWAAPVGFVSAVPFVIFYLEPFNRSLAYASIRSRLDKAPPARTPFAIKKQLEALHGL